jgi:PhnB protein
MTPTSRPDPIPDTYRRVTPCLVVQGGAKALEFYATVFGATERSRFPGPGGTVAHAEIEIGDSVVIVEEEDPQRGPRRRRPVGWPAPRSSSSST